MIDIPKSMNLKALASCSVLLLMLLYIIWPISELKDSDQLKWEQSFSINVGKRKEDAFKWASKHSLEFTKFSRYKSSNFKDSYIAAVPTIKNNCDKCFEKDLRIRFEVNDEDVIISYGVWFLCLKNPAYINNNFCA